ncbi:MAG: hypothetical protein NTZ54_19050, partial [Alphaproteobacteria bacterium]|nr:hypothetical protein [Alphaproteobacteria bacterium]
MPRDEMHRPLKRLSLGQRLWRRRPGAIPAAAVAMALAFLGGGLWVSRIPAPLAGEPVVMVAIPENAEIVTSSTTPADDPIPPADTDQSPEDVIDQSTVQSIGGGQHVGGMQVQDLAPEDEAAPESHEAMIIVAPHRALKVAPIEAVTEKTDQGPLPRIGGNG